MKHNVVQMLKGYLFSASGAWLLGAMVIQFLATSASWATSIDREPLPGVLLAAAGAVITRPAQTLPWRILPISSRAMNIAHWCAIVAVPGIVLTATLALVEVVNQGDGWRVPAGGVIGWQMAILWCVLGVLAWLTPLLSWQRLDARGRTGCVATWGTFALLAAYGYPLREKTPLFVTVPIILGSVLLIGSLMRVLGSELPSDALAALPDRGAAGRGGMVGRLYGWARLGRLLLGRTLTMAIVCTGGVSTLRWIYPQATEALIWAFFGTVSVWSGLATRPWLRSLWFWRCLPFSSQRLATILQLVALLPGTITLLIALAINRLIPSASVPFPTWLIVAFAALQSIIATQIGAGGDRPHTGTAHLRWITDSVRLALPAYLGTLMLAVRVVVPNAHLGWLTETMWSVSIVLLAAGYYLTLGHVRSAGASGRRE